MFLWWCGVYWSRTGVVFLWSCFLVVFLRWCFCGGVFGCRAGVVLELLVHLPRTWLLARLTIPLEGLSKQLDRLLEGYCFQILANRDPEAHNGRVLQTATHLTWILAEYLADTIAWLMRSILGHASKILFDKDTQLLLTPKFWILPLYREFLNSARGGVVVFLFCVMVFLWWCFLFWCGGVFVVVFLCLCFCGGGGVFVVTWWCFCGGVFVMFLWWCFCVFVVVFLYVFLSRVDFYRITEKLCKECWLHWCKKMSGIKVLLALLLSTLTSNISFI